MNEMIAALLFKKLGGSGGGGYPEPTGTKQITANANGIDVKDYAEADVNVPNTYQQGDEGKVVSQGALVSQSSRNINSNGTVDTTLNDEVVVAVPNSYSAGDEGKVVDQGALVSQTARVIGQNGTYDTTKNNSVRVAVSQPQGTTYVYSNGTYDVSSYQYAEVNVEELTLLCYVFGCEFDGSEPLPYEGGSAYLTSDDPNAFDGYSDYDYIVALGHYKGYKFLIQGQITDISQAPYVIASVDKVNQIINDNGELCFIHDCQVRQLPETTVLESIPYGDLTGYSNDNKYVACTYDGSNIGLMYGTITNKYGEFDAAVTIESSFTPQYRQFQSNEVVWVSEATCGDLPRLSYDVWIEIISNPEIVPSMSGSIPIVFHADFIDTDGIKHTYILFGVVDDTDGVDRVHIYVEWMIETTGKDPYDPNANNGNNDQSGSDFSEFPEVTP